MNTPKPNLTPIPIFGKSMWPLLEGGEILLVDIPVKPIVLDKKDIGTLFVFKDGSDWICHRYLGIKDKLFLFKGDYSTGYEAFEVPHVLGRVEGYQAIDGVYIGFKKTSFDKIIPFLQLQSLRKKKISRLFRYIALTLLLFRKKCF